MGSNNVNGLFNNRAANINNFSGGNSSGVSANNDPSHRASTITSLRAPRANSNSSPGPSAGTAAKPTINQKYPGPAEPIVTLDDDDFAEDLALQEIEEAESNLEVYSCFLPVIYNVCVILQYLSSASIYQPINYFHIDTCKQ